MAKTEGFRLCPHGKQTGFPCEPCKDSTPIVEDGCRVAACPNPPARAARGYAIGLCFDHLELLNEEQERIWDLRRSAGEFV